ncbi:MAG: hypothetical protein WA152_02860 [Microgenomates group bacterium]
MIEIGLVFQSDSPWTNACYEDGVEPPKPTKREATETPPPPKPEPKPVVKAKVVVPAQRPTLRPDLWKPDAPTPD